jgi:hypothetical protein
VQELVFMQNSGDDELDLRRFVNKDTDLPPSKRFDSPYVLFVPGYTNAPPEIRATGRVRVTVTNEQADELMTHPVWRFVTPEVADEIQRRARARFVAEMPSLAERRQIDADQIGPAVEIAPTAPATVTSVRAEAKSVAANATEGEGEKK